MNIYNGIPGVALVGTMAAGVVAGLVAGTAYVPYTALAVAGLVWYAMCRREAPRVAVGYAVLGACVLLAVAAYGDMKQTLLEPDITGVVCTAGGLVGLAVVVRWTVSHVPPVLRA